MKMCQASRSGSTTAAGLLSLDPEADGRGLSILSSQGTLTPYGEFGLASERTHDRRLGMRLDMTPRTT